MNCFYDENEIYVRERRWNGWVKALLHFFLMLLIVLIQCVTDVLMFGVQVAVVWLFLSDVRLELRRRNCDFRLLR